MAITSFKHRGLKRFYHRGQAEKIKPEHRVRIELLLDFLNGIVTLSDCVGRKGFHPLKGNRAGECAFNIDRNYRLTFMFDGKDVNNVNYEDYHEK